MMNRGIEMKALNNINSGYIGTEESWRYFFKQAIDTEFFAEEMSKFKDENWGEIKKELYILLNKPSITTIDEIRSKEKALGITLPKSYKDFVLANGIEFYNLIAYDFFVYINLLPVKKINFYKKINLKELKILIKTLNYSKESKVLENYYSYNDYKESLNQYNGFCNPLLKGLHSALGESSFGFIESKKNIYENAIALDDEDIVSMMFLPNELTKDNEMESWLLEGPDIYRFRSFAEMLVNNIFHFHKIPENLSLFEYLTIHGVNNILDFEILRETAIP